MPSVFDIIGVTFKSKLESSTNILRSSVMYIDGALPSCCTTTKKLVDDLVVYKFIPPNNYQILEKIDTSKIRNLDASLFLEINSSCFYKFDVTLEKHIRHAYSMPLKIIPKLLKEPKKYPLIFFEKNVFEIGLTNGNKYCILEAGIIKNAFEIIESETGVVPDGLIEIGFPDYDMQTKKIIQEAGKILKLEIQLYDNMGYRDMELVKFEDS
uniref:Uncharacterized protein n=1 Tax=Panagrolaimus davidi TaxID=227884 RepID=A0A914PR22_9BILA